jgi:hypothetical protein
LDACGAGAAEHEQDAGEMIAREHRVIRRKGIAMRGQCHLNATNARERALRQLQRASSPGQVTRSDYCAKASAYVTSTSQILALVSSSQLNLEHPTPA